MSRRPLVAFAAALTMMAVPPAAGPSPASPESADSHCLRGDPGGVALLLLNTDKAATRTAILPRGARRHTLSSTDRLSRRVELNGAELKLGADDTLPDLAGPPISPGPLTLAPATINFVTVPGAGNSSCR